MALFSDLLGYALHHLVYHSFHPSGWQHHSLSAVFDPPAKFGFANPWILKPSDIPSDSDRRVNNVWASLITAQCSRLYDFLSMFQWLGIANSTLMYIIDMGHQVNCYSKRCACFVLFLLAFRLRMLGYGSTLMIFSYQVFSQVGYPRCSTSQLQEGLPSGTQVPQDYGKKLIFPSSNWVCSKSTSANPRSLFSSSNGILIFVSSLIL